VPAANPVAVVPFCTGAVFQLKAYGLVPPVAEMVAVPVLPPEQLTLVCAAMVVPNAVEGCVMVTVRSVVQPFASVMVQVQVPAGKAVAVAVFCTGVVFQL
jgi:hypothetical protein